MPLGCVLRVRRTILDGLKGQKHKIILTSGGARGGLSHMCGWAVLPVGIAVVLYNNFVIH